LPLGPLGHHRGSPAKHEGGSGAREKPLAGLFRGDQRTRGGVELGGGGHVVAGPQRGSGLGAARRPGAATPRGRGYGPGPEGTGVSPRRSKAERSRSLSGLAGEKAGGGGAGRGGRAVPAQRGGKGVSARSKSFPRIGEGRFRTTEGRRRSPRLRGLPPPQATRIGPLRNHSRPGEGLRVGRARLGSEGVTGIGGTSPERAGFAGQAVGDRHKQAALPAQTVSVAEYRTGGCRRGPAGGPLSGHAHGERLALELGARIGPESKRARGSESGPEGGLVLGEGCWINGGPLGGGRRVCKGGTGGTRGGSGGPRAIVGGTRGEGFGAGPDVPPPARLPKGLRLNLEDGQPHPA